MRETKFRAWQPFHKQMVNVHKIEWNCKTGEIELICVEYLYKNGRELISYSIYNKQFPLIQDGIPSLILLPYINRKDKDGVEIYKGDIISADFDGEEMLFEVAWNENAMAWDIKDKNGVFYFDIYENGSPFKFLKNIKVIGNIYENPELLKEIE